MFDKNNYISLESAGFRRIIFNKEFITEKDAMLTFFFMPMLTFYCFGAL